MRFSKASKFTPAFLKARRKTSRRVPPAELANLWTLAICHRLSLSLKQAFTSRDPTEGTWRGFVRAWERAHLDRTGYFEHHPRAFGSP